MTSIARCLVTLLLTTISLTSTTPAESIKQQAKLDPRQIFKLYNDSVVTIETDLGKGSGFFVKDGSYVATCFHVVAGASHIEIHGTKNEKWLIESVAFDKDTDAALLKLTDQSKRRSIPVGDYSKLVTGEDLCVIGNPLGFLDETLTTGIVSARRNNGKADLIQTTAAISPGSSGSPVLNSFGQFVGFVSYHFTEGQSLNMAVSSSHIVGLFSASQVPVSMLVETTRTPVKSTLAKGLGIEETKVGTGEAVKPYDVVEVEYTGNLMNGKVFDSNAGKNQPFRFQVGIGMVIKGWDQGFIGMKLNGERKLEIPPDLAYGERGAGEVIPPNSTLAFKVKLLRVLPTAKITISKVGTGDPIKVNQFLECNISIKLPNGKELADPTRTSKLQLSRQMRPWINQAIGGIKVGEKRKVIVNYEMAFGEKGVPPADQDGKKAGSDIPPKSDLTIEVEATKISG